MLRSSTQENRPFCAPFHSVTTRDLAISTVVTSRDLLLGEISAHAPATSRANHKRCKLLRSLKIKHQILIYSLNSLHRGSLVAMVFGHTIQPPSLGSTKHTDTTAVFYRLVPHSEKSVPQPPTASSLPKPQPSMRQARISTSHTNLRQALILQARLDAGGCQLWQHLVKRRPARLSELPP